MVRDQRTTDKHDRDLGGLIRQAIIDRLKTTGEVFPDDLIPLYPEGEVDRCRELATAQFGSLASPRGGREPLIREKGRRKSSIPARKGAKATVWEFTPAGRIHYGLSASPLVGPSRGVSGKVAPTAGSGESEIAGLTAAAEGTAHPRDGRSGEPGDQIGAGHPLDKCDEGSPPGSVAAGTDSPDHCIDAGQNRGKSDQGSPSGSTSPAAGDGASLLSLDEARRSAPSAYDPWAA